MQNYNCKTCGAVLYWDTDANCLKCQFCGAVYQPIDFEDQTKTQETVESEEIDKEYTIRKKREYLFMNVKHVVGKLLH